MSIETLSDKDLQELERLTRELIAVLRKAKMNDQPLAEMLYELETRAGNLRRERFDSSNPQYDGY
jgi:hypothetical protein